MFNFLAPLQKQGKRAEALFFKTEVLRSRLMFNNDLTKLS